MAQTPEGRVKDAVKKVLKEFGVWYYMPVSTGFQKAGIPDFVGVLPRSGRFIGIETKAPGKKGNATENQKRIRDELVAQGAVSIIVDDAEEIRRLLNELC